MNHQSPAQQPHNILSFAQVWLQNNMGRMTPNQVDVESSRHPLDRALYQRVLQIADELDEENANPYASSNR